MPRRKVVPEEPAVRKVRLFNSTSFQVYVPLVGGSSFSIPPRSRSRSVWDENQIESLPAGVRVLVEK